MPGCRRAFKLFYLTCFAFTCQVCCGRNYMEQNFFRPSLDDNPQSDTPEGSRVEGEDESGFNVLSFQHYANDKGWTSRSGRVFRRAHQKKQRGYASSTTVTSSGSRSRYDSEMTSVAGSIISTEPTRSERSGNSRRMHMRTSEHMGDENLAMVVYDPRRQPGQKRGKNYALRARVEEVPDESDQTRRVVTKGKPGKAKTMAKEQKHEHKQKRPSSAATGTSSRGGAAAGMPNPMIGRRRGEKKFPNIYMSTAEMESNSAAAGATNAKGKKPHPHSHHQKQTQQKQKQPRPPEEGDFSMTAQEEADAMKQWPAGMPWFDPQGRKIPLHSSSVAETSDIKGKKRAVPSSRNSSSGWSSRR